MPGTTELGVDAMGSAFVGGDTSSSPFSGAVLGLSSSRAVRPMERVSGDSFDELFGN